MKKKLLLSGSVVVLLAWILTGHSPFQLLVSFIAAGALPGIHIMISPYLMFGLAFIGGLLLLVKLPTIEFHLPHHAIDDEEVQIKSLKITSRTHHRATKTRRRFTQIEI